MRDIVAVVLAAGESRRMGFPKALLPLGSGTFLDQILNTLQESGLSEPMVVIGAHARHIQPALARRPVRVVTNPDYEKGQLSSVKRALENVGPDVRGCLLWPVDHPTVSRDLVEKLIQLFLDAKPLLALPVYEGRRGHPAILSPALFQEILDTPTEAGMKGVVQRHQDAIALLPTGESSVAHDIDTPEDFFKLTGETLEAALARAHKL